MVYLHLRVTTDNITTDNHVVLVGEPKSRILQNDKKIAPDFDMADFLFFGGLNSA